MHFAAVFSVLFFAVFSCGFFQTIPPGASFHGSQRYASVKFSKRLLGHLRSLRRASPKKKNSLPLLFAHPCQYIYLLCLDIFLLLTPRFVL